ncbi:MAG: hypothetical protein ACI8P7_000590 [Candidatus Azotimanducaceae bacterium]
METGTSIITPSIRHTDGGFSKAEAQFCHVSFQVEPDGFSFAILDIRTNEYRMLESYEWDDLQNEYQLATRIKNLIDQHEQLRYPFASASATLYSSYTTLVPSPLFKEENAIDYAAFNMRLLPGDQVSYDALSQTDCNNVYIDNDVVKDALLTYFSNLTSKHPSTILIESLLRDYKQDSEPQVTIHVSPSHFEIIVITNGNLMFHNSFMHKTGEDYGFYLLYVCDQLNLDRDFISLQLVGEIEVKSSMYEITQKYIRKISFGLRPADYHYHNLFADLPKHYHYNLFNQARCVL